VWGAVCLGWRWLLCLPTARIVASVLVRLREYVDVMIVDPSVVSEKNK